MRPWARRNIVHNKKKKRIPERGNRESGETKTTTASRRGYDKETKKQPGKRQTDSETRGLVREARRNKMGWKFKGVRKERRETRGSNASNIRQKEAASLRASVRSKEKGRDL